MEAEKLYNKINEVLAAWNPIGVPDDIATVEYEYFIPRIIDASGSEQTLMACLIEIATEFGFDINNPQHYNGLKNICSQILRIKESHI